MELSAFDEDLLRDLQNAGLLSKHQIYILRIEHKATQKPMRLLITEMQFLSNDTLMPFLGGRYDTEIQPNWELSERLPEDLRDAVVPMTSSDGSRIVLAMNNPNNLEDFDRARRHLPTETLIERGPLNASSVTFRERNPLENLSQEGAPSESEIVLFVDHLLEQAVALGVSDVHFDPEAGGIRVRYRVHGILETAFLFHRNRWSAVVVRLKIVSRLNIAEHRRPQDGRFSQTVSGRTVDFRIATHPTLHGENIVVRILDQKQTVLSLNTLGYTEAMLKKLERLSAKPEGLLVVTGPTGSGKTTTLYGLISRLSSETLNIMTLEDPIEYALPRIRQTHVQEEAGFGFSEGVRSLLRQDPDVVLVGEIRDNETAHMALRACTAGNKVFATLHTRNALGAVYRFLDFQSSLALLVGNLLGIVAQRLVRRLCSKCKKAEVPSYADAERLQFLGFESAFCGPVGCAFCRGTGYDGRMAVAEILEMSEELETLLLEAPYSQKIKNYLKAHGFLTMTEEALGSVARGETSMAEVRRVFG